MKIVRELSDSGIDYQNILSGQNDNKHLKNSLQQRCRNAELLYGEFLRSLGYDIDNDPNMQDTPRRVVKMMTEEIGRGTYSDPPKITVFPNEGDNKYDGLVFQGNIDVKSLCAHHMAFIYGKCHVAYLPGPSIIGLSKLNRIVDWFSRRPQNQERLTTQIHDYLNQMLVDNLGIAVYIEATHTCVKMRGVEQDSMMKTAKLSGFFLDNTDKARDEFYQMISSLH